MCIKCGGAPKKVEVAAGFSRSVFEVTRCEGCKPGESLEMQLKSLDERLTVFVENHPEYKLSVY
jgi:hypothetical protein